MYKKIKSLFRDENGAVTVDWIVLTAAVVALAGAAYFSIQDASGGVGSATGEHLSNIEVN